MLISSSEAISLLGCSELHTFGHDWMGEEEKPAELLRLEEKGISLFSVIIEREYLFYKEVRWCRPFGLMYRTYLIIAGYNKKDVEGFAYGEGFPVRKHFEADSKKAGEERNPGDTNQNKEFNKEEKG